MRFDTKIIFNGDAYDEIILVVFIVSRNFSFCFEILNPWCFNHYVCFSLIDDLDTSILTMYCNVMKILALPRK